jgi:small-conductance mechanosensitive channel
MMQVKTIAEARAQHPETVQRVRRARHFMSPRRAWFGALLLVLAMFLLVAFAYFAAGLFLTGDRLMGYYALVSIVSWLVLKLGALWLTHQLRCNLCHGTILREKRCKKHHDGTKLPLLGYALSAAVAIVTTLHFSCMFCGTPYRLRK